MITIGDRVCSKKTGQPATGTVKAVMDAKYYHRMNNLGLHKEWFGLYPNYINKAVYYVEFDKPQINISLEEYKLSLPEEMRDDEKKIMCSYQLLKPSMSATYPEDDLEIL